MNEVQYIAFDVLIHHYHLLLHEDILNMIVYHMMDVDKSKNEEDMHQLYEFQHKDKMDLFKKKEVIL